MTEKNAEGAKSMLECKECGAFDAEGNPRRGLELVERYTAPDGTTRIYRCQDCSAAYRAIFDEATQRWGDPARMGTVMVRLLGTWGTMMEDPIADARRFEKQPWVEELREVAASAQSELVARVKSFGPPADFVGFVEWDRASAEVRVLSRADAIEAYQSHPLISHWLTRPKNPYLLSFFVIDKRSDIALPCGVVIGAAKGGDA